MPFLLIIFLTLACLPDVGWDPVKQRPTWGRALPSDWVPPSWQGALLTWLLVLFMVAWAGWLAWRVSRALQADPAGRDRALQRYERGRRRHHAALFVMYIVVLCVFGWGWVVGEYWSSPGGWVFPGAELLVLAPFFAAMVLSWVVFYDADRAAYLAAHKQAFLDPLARALLDQDVPLNLPTPAEVPPVLGGRWSYVLFKARHNLVLVLIPLTLLLLQKEVYRFFPGLIRDWHEVLTLLGFGVVLVVLMLMPWVVRLVLGLKPLPEGPLRRKLLAAAQRMKFRHSDILFWNTHGVMANAMVLGVLPWPRYVVFTDKLLEEFTAEEVLAVFGHEVGHIKHHHMLYYLTFLMASMMVLVLLVAVLVPGLADPAVAKPDSGLIFDLQNHPYLQSVPMMTLVLAYVFVVFGFVSRRCERQADIYGCRAVSCGLPDCLGHDGETAPTGRTPPPCPTGIRIFIQALEKVALLNGINREKPGFLQSWQHSTIARRVAFLQEMLRDPAIEPRFQRGVLLVKCGLFLMLGAVLLALVGAGSLAKGPKESPQQEKGVSRSAGIAS
jgi:Zn-dependent protease with chaperone function